MLKPEELNAFVETARRFAAREVGPLLEGETRDGNLGIISDLLGKAESAGLLASADPDSAGYEFGVWGRACLDHGPAFSLALLEEISESCAAVAACLHFAGLGALETRDFKPFSRGAVAFFEDGWRLTWKVLREPPAGAARLISEKNGVHYLRGAKSFVNAIPQCNAFLVYAASDSGWQRVLLPKDASRLSVLRPGIRAGLSAVDLFHLSFNNTPISESDILPSSDLPAFVTRLFLGLAAISVGNAAGALERARSYAAERYQGGGMIETHPAILGLLGDATSRVYACAAHMETAAKKEGRPEEILRHAAVAKLRITEECCQAVTDCMQVLGGYGYMEDFRVEKRLRDALTLKSMCVRPEDLRMLCAHVD